MYNDLPEGCAHMNQIKAGIVLNYIVIGLNALVGLLYTPYMLRMMGLSEYGLYSLVASVIAYLTVMDFGLGNAVIRYTAKFRAEGKYEEQYAMFGMFVAIYSLIGLLALGAGLLLYFNVETLFGSTMTAAEIGRARVLMIILIFNLAATFPLSTFGSIVTAYEDFVFLKIVQIVRILLNTAVMVCLLKMGYRAVAMVVVQTLFNLATLLLNYIYCRYKIRIKIVFRRFHWPLLKEIGVYSFWILLNVIVDRIYWSTGQFVLGAFAGTAVVAVFALGIQLQQMYMSFSTAITGVFLPRVTAMITTQKSDAEVSNLFIRSGRIQFIVLAFILSGFLLFGRRFIVMWAGDAYAGAYPIALLFLVALTVPLIQNLGITILEARNQLKFRSLLYLTIALTSLAFQIPAAKHFGAVGCAATIASALFLGQVVVMNIYYQSRQGIDIVRFWREIAKMSVAPLAMAVISACLMHWVKLDSVWRFAAGIALFTAVYMPVIWRFSMNNYERGLFKAPILRLFRTLST